MKKVNNMRIRLINFINVDIKKIVSSADPTFYIKYLDIHVGQAYAIEDMNHV